MIELIMVIGVLTVLSGIILPSVGRSVDRARLTHDMALVQQNALLINTYTHDHKDIYPIAHTQPVLAGRLFYGPLRAGGYIRAYAEVDPRGFKRNQESSIYMSMCMVYDPDLMRPGWTIPYEDMVARPVAQYQVAYPSHKGMLLQSYRIAPLEVAGHFCCVYPLVKVPVAMTDGSTMIGDRTEFSMGQPVVVQDWIGYPIFSTWGGYLARDR